MTSLIIISSILGLYLLFLLILWGISEIQDLILDILGSFKEESKNNILKKRDSKRLKSKRK